MPNLSFTILDRCKMIAKQGEHLVDLIHADCRFPLLDIPHKPQPNTGSLRQLRLRQSRFLPQFLDLSAKRSGYTRSGIESFSFHDGYTNKGYKF